MNDLADKPLLPPKPTKPIPLHLVGGLYGSGKTSLLQHWISEAWQAQRLGLILCEEGQRKLDFSQSPAPRIDRLLNACVCCEMAFSFFEIVVQMLGDTSIERIVVELTAQADIRQIMDLIQSSHLKDYLQFEPVHILVDPRNPHMRRGSTSPLIQRMVEQADVFVLGFQDIASAREMDRCMGWIQTFEPGQKSWITSPWQSSKQRA